MGKKSPTPPPPLCNKSWTEKVSHGERDRRRKKGKQWEKSGVVTGHSVQLCTTVATAAEVVSAADIMDSRSNAILPLLLSALSLRDSQRAKRKRVPPPPPPPPPPIPRTSQLMNQSRNGRLGQQATDLWTDFYRQTFVLFFRDQFCWNKAMRIKGLT